MFHKSYIFLLLLTFLMSSCRDDSMSFGTVKYYPEFLWVDASLTPVTKTFCFDFSEDAKRMPDCGAEFYFVDNEGKPISTDVMQVTANGNQLKDNILKVSSSTDEVKLDFTFSDQANSGKYQGYLKLKGHNKLTRIDAIDLTQSQHPNLFQWTLNYEKNMNPLALTLIWILVVIASVILLWFMFIQRQVFRRFKAINKMIIIPGHSPISLHFKGKRMIVIDNKRYKQSFWNKLWTGEIQYIQNPAITAKITLKPMQRGRKIMFISNAANYICSPNPIAMQPSRVNDMNNKNTIIIQ